jgi:SAM-dependent methyltransferase
MHKEAYSEDFMFHDENRLMLSWYSRRIIKVIRAVSRTIVLEPGSLLDKYIIIEGSRKIIEEFTNEVELPENVSVKNVLFEEFSTGEKFDVIEMGFVLEHIDDPQGLIRKYKDFLRPQGSIFIAVPNARSLHRVIGNRAGLLDDLYSLSKHDLELGHKRYFDKESLTKIVLESGLKILNTEGIFLKPFSTSQIRSLNLPQEVLDALFSTAVDSPDISNAIYVEAAF